MPYVGERIGKGYVDLDKYTLKYMKAAAQV
jgi:hypothetical protein